MESRILFQAKWLCCEVRRNLARTLLTVAGIAIATALLVGVVSFYGGYRAALRRGIDHLGFEVLVTAKGCPYEAATMFLRGGTIPMYLDEGVTNAVVSDPVVAEHTRLFLQAVPADDNRRFLFLGVDNRFRTMKPWLELETGTWLGDARGFDVVLGYNVATEIDRGTGDELSLDGLPRALRIVGTLRRTGSQDDGTFFIPLRTAQKLFDRKDRLTGIGIKVHDIDELPRYLEKLYDLPAIQVVTLSQAQSVILGFVTTARNLVGSVGVLTAIVALLLLFNTLSISFLERRGELSLLRAIGASGSFLFVVTLAESCALTLAGAASGVALASVSGTVVDHVLRDTLPFSPEGPLLELETSTVLMAFAAAAVAGIACAIIPAWRAAAVEPRRALRGDE